jgi:uncharacterized repeat protein (TIGR01451 family)
VTGAVSENVDQDDNGIDSATPATTGIRSAVITLNAAENTGDPSNAPVETLPQAGVAADASYDATVDFGFVPRFSLGNRVWSDTGAGANTNNGLIDGDELGIPGVTVRLFTDANNDGIPDSVIPLATVLTDAAGYYRFDNLAAGNYIVEVATPAGFSSSTVNAGDPDVDTDDSDDNGVVIVGTNVRSNTVTLGGTEPTGETDVPASYGPGSTTGTDAPDDRSNLTVDFGFITQTYSLGNRVWLDAGPGAQTNNGILDAGETGIAGVTVRILDAAGNPTLDLDPVAGGVQNTVITDAAGYYRFDGLSAGTYVVEVEIPAGLASSTVDGGDPDADIDDNDDNGVVIVGTNVRSNPVTLGPGAVEPTGETEPGAYGPGSTLGGAPAPDAQSNLTVDFGFYPPATTYSLGNRVWSDTGPGPQTNNGILDAGESGIAGVTVRLYNDTNNDGTPDGGVIATVITDAAGYYRFDNLAAGNYIVEVVTPVGFASSTVDAGDPDVDADDSDDNGVIIIGGVVRSSTVTVGPGDSEPTTETDIPGAYGPGSTTGTEAPNNRGNLTIDFGFYQPLDTFSLGNRVWADTGAGANTNNGILDPGESGIAGVTVNLYRDTNGDGTPDGGIIATVVTDAGGYYRFDNLTAGDYIVEVVTPSGFISSTVDAGDPDLDPDDTDDNGVNVLGATVRSNTITLAAPEPLGETDIPAAYGPGSTTGTDAPDDRSNLTVDFGFFSAAYSLGNRVWLDTGAGANANNGLLDSDESGVAGVTVNLYRDSNDDGTPEVLVATVITDAAGYYRFDNLTADTYIVEIIAPPGFSSSTPDAGDPDIDLDDSDDNGVVISGTSIRSNPVTLGPGDSEPVGEPDQPASYGPGSTTGVGAVDNRSNLTVDFGLFTQTYSLGNRVWADTGAGANTNNGILDADELGIPGVTVNLYRDSNGDGTPDGGVIATVTTDADGYYRFDGLSPDTYIVEVITPVGFASSTVNGGDPDADVDDVDDNGVIIVGTGVRSNPVTLGPGDSEPAGETEPGAYGPGSTTGTAAPDLRSNLTVDFGFYQPAERVAIGNRVWIDVNGNGVFDAGDTAPTGPVTLQLYTEGSQPGVDPTAAPDVTTDVNGRYVFDNLLPGRYFVFIPASSFAPGQPLANLVSSPGAGTDETIDETGDENGQDIPVNGGIRSGVYDLQPNTEPVGDDDTDYTGTLDDDNVNLTADFAFTTLTNPLSLGNRVWIDANNNGLLDGGESGLDGVTVALFADSNADGVPDGGTLATTTTAGGGYYLFDNLLPGTYVVAVLPSNFTGGGPLVNYLSSTGAGQEALPNNDVDSNDNGRDSATPATTGILSGPVTLSVGGEPQAEPDAGGPGSGTATDPNSNLTVDFGFYLPPVGTLSLGNRVWIDTDNSGTLNVGEVGIGGVRVELFRDDDGDGVPDAGGLIAATTTDGSGFYLFPGLLPGGYVVVIPASNFQAGGPLEGSFSSSGPGQEAAPNSDGDSNDNGIDNPNPAVNGIRSGTVTLAAGTEPTGEPGPSTGGSADADSNLTVDFGFTPPAVQPPPTPQPPPDQPQSVPPPRLLDPAIVKAGDPAFAQPGETVTWIITVFNPNGVDLSSVGFTDDVPNELTILGVTTSEGSASFSGQTVTFNIGTLRANSTVTISVRTRVRPNVIPPFTITNVAVLSNPYSGSAAGTVSSVVGLPETGQTPWWRDAVLVIAIGGLMAGAAYALARRRMISRR